MRVGVDAPARTGAGSGGNLAVDKGDASGAAGWRIGADRHLYFLPLSRPRIRRKPTMARSLCRAAELVPQRGARARFAGGIRPIDARVDIGLAVRKGISRPGISSPEALMRTLLAAAAKELRSNRPSADRLPRRSPSSMALGVRTSPTVIGRPAPSAAWTGLHAPVRACRLHGSGADPKLGAPRSTSAKLVDGNVEFVQ